MPSVRCSHPLGQAWRTNLVSALASLRPGRELDNYEYYCLTLQRAKTYNIVDAEVAQVVEQRTENPRVSGSTPLLGTTHEP
jgi:hypothetical protein